MTDYIWKLSNLNTNIFFCHQNEESNKKQWNEYFSEAQSSKLTLLQVDKKIVLVFQPLGKENKKKWKWTLTCSSITMIKNWLKNGALCIFLSRQICPVSGCQKNFSWFSNLQEKINIKKWKWTLTCSSITMIKNLLKNDALCIFLSRQIWSCFGLSKEFFLVFQPPGKRNVI